MKVETKLIQGKYYNKHLLLTLKKDRAEKFKTERHKIMVCFQILSNKHKNVGGLHPSLGPPNYKPHIMTSTR